MICWYLIFNLIYMVCGSFIFYTGDIIKKFTYKEYAIGLRFLLVVNTIILLASIMKKWKNRELINIKNPIYLGVLLCLILGIVSTIFSVDKNISLEGCADRYEGLYTVLYYLTLMLISSFVSDKQKKIIVNSIIICASIQAIYTIFQIFSLFNVKLVLHAFKVYDSKVDANVYNSEIWATGFTTNPNFLGTYMLLCLSYSIGLFVESKKKWQIIIYALFTGLFTFTLLISNAMSCIVGLLFVLFVTLIYSIINKQYFKLCVLILMLLCITLVAIKLGKTKFINDTSTTGIEATQIIKGNVDDKYGSRRIYIWKKTLEIIPKYILHGVGIDCFHKAFDGNPLTVVDGNYSALFDKAHNEYLQILVTQGIFALVSYLFIYGYAVFYGIKNGFRNKQIYLVLPVIGYLVQAFFNISVIEVAPIFWIGLGLCCASKNELKKLNDGKTYGR